MMGDTTYMTGRDAVAKKFADTLIDEEREPIAASADGRVPWKNIPASRPA